MMLVSKLKGVDTNKNVQRANTSSKPTLGDDYLVFKRSISMDFVIKNYKPKTGLVYEIKLEI